MWHAEASILTSADPARVFSIWADVPGWKTWNAGIETIQLHGAFATGTTFTMKPPGEEAFDSTLVHVDPAHGFTDETVLGEVRVLVQHTCERTPSGQTRIRYATEVSGPDAEAIGRRVTHDFPDVLAALKALAERG